MSSMGGKAARRGAGLTSDAALSVVGFSLAAASATFGIFMTMHGPVAEMGKSGQFTVFAQLAPRAAAPDKSRSTDLDLTATASIPKRNVGTSERAVASTVTIQTASTDEATLLIDGRPQIVRVGDTVQGLGEILAIIPGEKPLLRTTRGLITAAQQ